MHASKVFHIIFPSERSTCFYSWFFTGTYRHVLWIDWLCTVAIAETIKICTLCTVITAETDEATIFCLLITTCTFKIINIIYYILYILYYKIIQNNIIYTIYIILYYYCGNYNLPAFCVCFSNKIRIKINRKGEDWII